MRPLHRLAFAAIAVACASLVAYAIYHLQEDLGLEPCPMCILSRITFMALGAVALVAAIHGPRGAMLKAYGLAIALLAAVGVGISMRHSYLQHFPPKIESCGTDLEFLLNNLPMSQALPKIFAGTGSCSAVDWKFLGLSIPEWGGLWFLAMGLVALWIAFRQRPQRSSDEIGF